MLERLKKLIKQNMPDSDAEHATESTKLVDLGIDSIGMMHLRVLFSKLISKIPSPGKTLTFFSSLTTDS